MKFLGSILIFSGILLLAFTSLLIYQRQSPERLSFTNIEKLKSQSVKKADNPNRIIIEKIGVDLPIIASEIRDNNWPTSSTGISYLTTSSAPGSVGNSVLYGHNWQSILGNLYKINPGDEIKIRNADDQILRFVVTTTQVVDKTQSSVLNNTEDSRITLYTCTGFLDQKRLVVTAHLI